MTYRDFTSDSLSTRLAGAITYLRNGEGWLYLAKVIDWATRMVASCRNADHMRTSLAIGALAMALLQGHLEPAAIALHGRGTQYALSTYATYYAAIDLHVSMGRTGVSWDNAVSESSLYAVPDD